MDFSDAVTDSGNGVIISLDVSPGSKKTVFPAGFNEWRKAILCRISAPPVDGKANKEIVNALSKFFSVRTSDVSIVSGMTSSQKRVFVAVSRDSALALLSKSL